jgi:ABC-type multidrug transport system ATPase subunit
MTTVIDAHTLCKRFGTVTAVNGVTLSIPQGEIFGLLGPNAAGKSTTIRLLSGILSLDAGTARVLNYDLLTQTEEIKKRIGYVAQHFGLYPELTVAENLNFYSSIYHHMDHARQKQLLAKYGLARFADRRAGVLSGGYKRRLSIACALAHDPSLLFLDEPTAGIDPVTRKELWDIFYDLAARGTTLFVTTHYMEEAERCTRLAFIHQGNLVAAGTPTEIKASLTDKTVYACQSRHDPAIAESLKRIDGVRVLNQFGNELRIIADTTVRERDLAAVLAPNLSPGHPLRTVEPNIEDVFITLTRHGESL